MEVVRLQENFVINRKAGRIRICPVNHSPIIYALLMRGIFMRFKGCVYVRNWWIPRAGGHIHKLARGTS